MKIHVCEGSACRHNGSEEVKKELKKLVKEHHLKDDVKVVDMPCQGKCKKGICVKFHKEKYALSSDGAEEFFNTRVLLK